MSAITQETLSVSGILLSKVFERRADEIERYRRANERLAALQVRQQMTGQGFFALVQAFFGITPAIIYLVAGLSLDSGGQAISAGTIVAFTTLQTRLFFPIVQLLRVSVEIQSSLALFERVFEYLDLEPDIVDAPDAIALDPAQVQGRGRSTPSPSPTRRAVPRSTRPPSTATGAWRSTGCRSRWSPASWRLWWAERRRKTTVSYLVPRLYDPSAGSVRIDGLDVRDIKLAALAQIVGVSSRRRPTCSTPACATTCSTRGATPARRSSRRRPGRR